MYVRHRVVPLVIGVAGWVPLALEKELTLLFSRGGRNKEGVALATTLTHIAHNSALELRRLWNRGV